MFDGDLQDDGIRALLDAHGLYVPKIRLLIEYYTQDLVIIVTITSSIVFIYGVASYRPNYPPH